MPSEAVEMLTEHLAVVKRTNREIVERLANENDELKQENQSLNQKLQAVLDELDFRNGQIAQLKLEASEKWRVEERNDWRSLVDSVQKDRDELQAENERLKGELDLLRTHQPAISIDTSSHHSADPSQPHTPPGSDDWSPPYPPVSTPTTQLRRELKEAKRRLADEHATLEQERREASRLRQELDARRQRERWQQSGGLLRRLAHMTRLWHRGQLQGTPVLNV